MEREDGERERTGEEKKDIKGEEKEQVIGYGYDMIGATKYSLKQK